MGLISRVSSRTYRVSLMPRKRKLVTIPKSSSESGNSDSEYDDGCCDCIHNCKETPFEHRHYHDCAIVEQLFKQIDVKILQKLCNKVQFARSIESKEYDGGGFTITIHCKKKPEAERITKVCASKATVSDDSDYDYLDASTLEPRPRPAKEDKLPYIASDSEEEEDAKKKREQPETLCTKTYKDIVKRTWTQGFPCPYPLCNKSYSNFSELRKHENVVHLQHRIMCTWPNCQKMFATAKYMRRHIMTTHRGVKQFECSLCGNEYRHKNGLEEHIRTHTGEKPFECSGCHAKFHARKTWRDHQNK